MTIDVNIHRLDNFSLGFWSGWLGGSAIIAGGKLWTTLFAPEQRVSTLLGPIATPAFRRQLAVGITVYAISTHLFDVIAIKAKIDFRTNQGKAYLLITRAVGISAGLLAGAATTHVAYHYVLYASIAYTVARAAFELYKYAKQ